MRKFLILSMVIIIIMSLYACSNEEQIDYKSFDQEMQKVYKITENIELELSKINLVEISKLFDTEVDKNDIKKLKATERNIAEDIEPLIEERKTTLKNIKPNNEEQKKLYQMYEENVTDVDNTIQDIQEYIHAYNKIISSNEIIISLTEVIDSAKKEREDIINRVNKQGSSQEKKAIEELIEKINENNEKLNSKASKLSSGELTGKAKEDYIENEIFPLLESHISEINKNKANSNSEKTLRDKTIEIYYTLKNYYSERKKMIQYSDLMQEIDIQPKLDIKKYATRLEESYHEKRKEYEESIGITKD